MYNELPASVIILDTRNFTNNFKHFNRKNDYSFVEFIENIWQTGIDIAGIVIEKEKYHINSTGDGFVLIYFGLEHEKKAYITGIILNKILNKKCRNFSIKHKCDVSFGIGIETGKVTEICVNSSERNYYTYLGNVINKAVRIETETKGHARASLLIGNNLNAYLVKQLFNIDYNQLMEEVKNNSNDQDLVIANMNKMNEINQKMMLSYIFEHNLKGVEDPVPLFRLSPTLANENNPEFHKLMEQMCNPQTYVEIKKVMEEE